MNISEKADFYRENFGFCEGWEEKYQYLIDLGNSLPVLPSEDMIDAHRVEGCMSRVWLIASMTDGCLHLRAQSDAVIVRGLIALIVDLCQSQPAIQVAKFDFGQFFTDIGLADQLSPNRRNGLVAFYRKIQEWAHH